MLAEEIISINDVIRSWDSHCAQRGYAVVDTGEHKIGLLADTTQNIAGAIEHFCNEGAAIILSEYLPDELPDSLSEYHWNFFREHFFFLPIRDLESLPKAYQQPKPKGKIVFLYDSTQTSTQPPRRDLSGQILSENISVLEFIPVLKKFPERYQLVDTAHQPIPSALYREAALCVWALQSGPSSFKEKLLAAQQGCLLIHWNEQNGTSPFRFGLFGLSEAAFFLPNTTHTLREKLSTLENKLSQLRSNGLKNEVNFDTLDQALQPYEEGPLANEIEAQLTGATHNSVQPSQHLVKKIYRNLPPSSYWNIRESLFGYNTGNYPHDYDHRFSYSALPFYANFFLLEKEESQKHPFPAEANARLRTGAFHLVLNLCNYEGNQFIFENYNNTFPWIAEEALLHIESIYQRSPQERGLHALLARAAHTLDCQNLKAIATDCFSKDQHYHRHDKTNENIVAFQWHTADGLSDKFDEQIAQFYQDNSTAFGLYSQIGDVYFMRDQKDIAARCYLKDVEHNRLPRDKFSSALQALASAGEIETARELAQKLIKLDPSFNDSELAIATGIRSGHSENIISATANHAFHSQANKGIKLCLEGIQKGHTDSRLNSLLAYFYLAQGDVEACLKYAQSDIPTTVTRPYLAFFLWALGHSNAARLLISKEVFQAQKFAPHLLRFAVTSCLLNRSEQALSAFTLFHQQNPHALHCNTCYPAQWGALYLACQALQLNEKAAHCATEAKKHFKLFKHFEALTERVPTIHDSALQNAVSNLRFIA